MRPAYKKEAKMFGSIYQSIFSSVLTPLVLAMFCYVFYHKAPQECQGIFVITGCECLAAAFLYMF